MTITHFSNAQIFDGETPDLKTDCYVEVSDNKITYIGREKPNSRCDYAFDLKGSTIMPGLIVPIFMLMRPIVISLNLKLYLKATWPTKALNYSAGRWSAGSPLSGMLAGLIMAYGGRLKRD